MQYDLVGQIGATTLTVPTGLTGIAVLPDRGQNGGMIKMLSGGTLALAQAQGISYTLGYVMGLSEVITMSGPAVFFLVASGATCTVSYMKSYGTGYSLPVGG